MVLGQGIYTLPFHPLMKGKTMAQAINGPLTKAMTEWEDINNALNGGTVLGVPFHAARWATEFKQAMEGKRDFIAGTFTMSEVRFLFYMPTNHTY